MRSPTARTKQFLEAQLTAHLDKQASQIQKVSAQLEASKYCAARGKISRTENRTAKCLSEKEQEDFNHAVFVLAFFSRQQDRELLGAISRDLLDCPCRV